MHCEYLTPKIILGGSDSSQVELSLAGCAIKACAAGSFLAHSPDASCASSCSKCPAGMTSMPGFVGQVIIIIIIIIILIIVAIIRITIGRQRATGMPLSWR